MRKGIVIIYMDDLIIPAKDEDEGIEKLKKVFEVASKYGLEIKFKKCQFLRRKVECLGHVVENGTLRPSVAKTIAVKKFPVPTTVKQVQSFLGLTGYFRKFIPAYSKIAKPLSDLIRSDNPFVFEQPQIEVFEKLKKLLTESPVLSIFQQEKQPNCTRTQASKGTEPSYSKKRKMENCILFNTCLRKLLQQRRSIAAMNLKFSLLSTL
ncbi:Retrovirus-related Pol polyprotein from transposon 17.6 [Araneus ventricosus]|uniref:Retrovirus-related Pol polyprotein from transposon 17.6 n=1 Tax=Araneus ventricosus TaxID=182803 RepID=A0A4Y2STZ3_ARAVE|nr:Retrovirus-related Pol polyprotein from transposon 17.6 [Araneus ventricosus]